MNWKQKRKIKQEEALKRTAAYFFNKEIDEVTIKELSITWIEITIEGLEKIIRYFKAIPIKTDYYDPKNELYTDAVQGRIVTLNRFLPALPFKHSKAPYILIGAAEADNQCGIGYGWDGEELYEQFTDESEDEDISFFLKSLKEIKREFETGQKSNSQTEKSKELPLCTDYKYSTKSINSIWTVRNK